MGLSRLAQRLAAALGLEVRRMSKAISDDGTYQLVRPNATYSPWQRDAVFQTAWAEVRDATLVDIYRGWELWQLVEQAAKLERGALLEVGVWRGGTGALIARRARLCGIHERTHLCDTFAGVVKAGANDTRYRGGEHADTDRGQVSALLSRMGLAEVDIHVGVFPEATGAPLAGERFRFCHIDVDVYQSAKDVLAWVWPRLVPGGMVVFDDYGFKGCEGVARLVEEEAGAADRILLRNLNGHAVMVKR
jgi:O-methyltransferase